MFLISLFGCSVVGFGKPHPTRDGESMMKTDDVNPPAEKRLLRMRKMFAAEGGILLDDYEYFMKRGEPTRPNTVTRRSAERHGRPILKRS